MKNTFNHYLEIFISDNISKTLVMASKDPQILNKRLAKPKTQYSPSNPTLTTTYHLIRYTDTQKIMIVGNSSVKRFIDDNTVVLNHGRTADLIVTGNTLFILRSD